MKLKKRVTIPMFALAVLALFATTYVVHAGTDKLIPYKQIATVTVPSGLVGGFDIAWTDSGTGRFGHDCSLT